MSAPDPRAVRLALACDAAMPPGPVAVFGPGAQDDLAPLGADTTVITRRRSLHDAFAARGFAVADAAGPGRFGAAVVCLPRARAAGRDLIAQAAVATRGPILVDGQKTDGIDAMLREVRARLPVGEPVVKAHGKLFRIEGAGVDAFADWRAAPRRLEGGFVTLPGVFSADGPDPGSMLLAGALPARLPARVADLGAGWGWLAAQVLAREGVAEVHLIEDDADALDCARRNLAGDARARFHWADATAFRPAERFDAVVANPPFHAGRASEPALGTAFIRAASAMLTPQGTLWLVANRHLPYEEALAAAFREVVALPGTPAFKLFRARSPLARPAAAAGRQRGVAAAARARRLA